MHAVSNYIFIVKIKPQNIKYIGNIIIVSRWLLSVTKPYLKVNTRLLTIVSEALKKNNKINIYILYSIKLYSIYKLPYYFVFE